MVRWWGMVMGFLVASTIRFVFVFLGLIGFPWCRYIACLFELNLVSSSYFDLFAHVDLSVCWNQSSTPTTDP